MSDNHKALNKSPELQKRLLEAEGQKGQNRPPTSQRSNRLKLSVDLQESGEKDANSVESFKLLHPRYGLHFDNTHKSHSHRSNSISSSAVAQQQPDRHRPLNPTRSPSNWTERYPVKNENSEGHTAEFVSLPTESNAADSARGRTPGLFIPKNILEMSKNSPWLNYSKFLESNQQSKSPQLDEDSLHPRMLRLKELDEKIQKYKSNSPEKSPKNVNFTESGKIASSNSSKWLSQPYSRFKTEDNERPKNSTLIKGHENPISSTSYQLPTHKRGKSDLIQYSVSSPKATSSIEEFTDRTIEKQPKEKPSQKITFADQTKSGQSSPKFGFKLNLDFVQFGQNGTQTLKISEEIPITKLTVTERSKSGPHWSTPPTENNTTRNTFSLNLTDLQELRGLGSGRQKDSAGTSQKTSFSQEKRWESETPSYIALESTDRKETKP